MRTIDEAAIRRHADRRFRSEYDYALFEYYRSAKVLAFLERVGVRPHGRLLDAGCGGGGMPVSFAEEADHVAAIDLVDRFRNAGERLARERRLANVSFLQANGQFLPFGDGRFDAVFSHAVIEHVADAGQYLAECRRVLKPAGWMYLSTAPYLSFAGAHLPRLKVPVPLHLLVGRRIAFPLFRAMARRTPWMLREPADENSFIQAARRGEVKHDDLLERVRVRSLRGRLQRAGLRIVHEELHVTGAFRRLPEPLATWLPTSPLTQDIVIGNMEYVLSRG